MRYVLQQKSSLRKNASGIRLLPLCQLFPRTFALEVFWTVPKDVPGAVEGSATLARPSLRIAASLVQSDTAATATAAAESSNAAQTGQHPPTAEASAPVPGERWPALASEVEALLEARLLKALHTHAASKEGPAPLPWLMRGIGGELEALVAAGPNPALMMHLRHGLAADADARQHAWYEAMAHHLAAFVHARPAVASWRAGPPCTRHDRCIACGAGLELSPDAPPPADGVVAKRAPTRGGGEVAAAAAEGAAEVAAEGAALETGELMEVCSAGGELIAVRGAVRTAKVFREELLVAAETVGLDPSLLRQLGAGLWLLHGPSSASSGPHAALRRLLPLLGGVRLTARILCAAPHARELAACVHRLRLPLARWSLQYEVNFPAADHAQLPFHRLAGAPELLVELIGALGTDFISDPAADPTADPVRPARASKPPVPGHLPPWLPPSVLRCLPCAPLPGLPTARSATPCRHLLALEMKTGLLLASLEDAIAHPADPRQLPLWIPPWDVRPFSFSASLDPLVAVAAVNIALLTALGRNGSPLDASHAYPPSHVRIFDPCVGSGTVLAAALSLGVAEVGGSDLRAEFVKGAARNLEAMGFVPPPLSVHDACEPFPLELLPREGVTSIIVSNPPWGRKIGALDDGAKIVRSLASQFKGALMCFMVNGAAVEALREMASVAVLRHVKLGSVEVVVAKAE